MNFLKKSATQNFFYVLEPGKVKNSIAFVMANVFVKDNYIYYISYKCNANKKYKKKDLLKWQIPLEEIKSKI